MPKSDCPACRAKLRPPQEGEPEREYCPYCGYYLLLPEHGSASMPKEEETAEHEPPTTMGAYRVIKQIGSGGMGKVYLVYDPHCRRKVALKKIRSSMRKKEVLAKRFLREAWITSQLTHPGIVPIYNIHADGDDLYYTMPYLEGRSLHEVLSRAMLIEEKGAVFDQTYDSIQSLLPIFMGICQAIAYAHSRQVIHRDLKPGNIMVGVYGEVFVLDWGLAKWVGEPETGEKEAIEEERMASSLTAPGKVFGTLSYMAPERAQGQPATYHTDIYSLGVILYQILCLRLPFERSDIKTLRKHADKERFIDPAKVAPYRNVPRVLAKMAQKCLSLRISERYESVAELLHELENYSQARSEWFEISKLDPNNKRDWEFQEHVYIADSIALTGTEGGSEWVSMMVSKESYPGNVKISCTVTIGDEGNGLGVLLGVPEPEERRHLNTGYLLWIGSDLMPGTKIFRSAVQVADIPELYLKRNKTYQLRIEKVENTLRFYVDHELKGSHVSHLPLPGTHLGLLYRDSDFTIENLAVSVGSYSVKVDCLAVPDAFLAEGFYEKALAEYRRIARSFPERDEGREAQFRAGITLLEEAHQSGTEQEYDLALAEFGKLGETPGAPLEYLGKALVYKTLGDNDEEAKCFEYAFRKYKNHPLLSLLQEQVIHLLHESSRINRLAAYRYLLLCAQHMEDVWHYRDMQALLDNLKRHWEPLPFIAPITEHEETIYGRIHTAAQLSFWLARTYAIVEVLDELKEDPIHPKATLDNCHYLLLELGATDLIDDPAFNTCIAPLDEVIDHIPAPVDIRTLRYLLTRALHTGRADLVPTLFEQSWAKEELLPYKIWGLLLQDEWQKAGKLLNSYPLEQLNTEESILYTLYGCWLANTEGEELARVHFTGALDTPYPRTHALLAHYLTNKITEGGNWGKQAFLYEWRHLYRGLHLWHHCLGNKEEAAKMAHLEQQQYLS